jgi:predicted PurR-regulated permease PerM
LGQGRVDPRRPGDRVHLFAEPDGQRLAALAGGIGWVVAWQFTALANDLPRYQENLKRKIVDVRALSTGGVIEKVQQTVEGILGELQQPAPPAPATLPPQTPGAGGAERAPEKPIPVVVQAPSVLWQLPSLLEFLATAGLVLVLVIFMLLRYADLRSRLIHLAGYGRLTVTTKALDEAGHRISRYLLMQSIINGSYGAAAGLGFFLIGVPYALLWGFLAAILRFIPYVGPTVAAVLPSAVSLAVFPGWGQPFLVIGLILLLELITNMVLEPLLYGQSIGVSEVALLVAVAFWTWLWGPVGLFLATPLTVCLGVLGRYVPQMQFIGVLLSDEPALQLHTNYYQRLVAQDQDKAAALVDDYVETHAVEEVYDAVLIPALNAMKRDRELGTLTAEDVRFIVQATRAIVEDLGIRQTPVATAAAATANAPAAAPPVPIVGCPAQDEADELALQMLRQLLDRSRYALQVLSAEMLTGEVVAAVEQQQAQLICIAAVPPEALAPTRYLCKRLRTRFPDCKIVVGRWGAEESDEPRALLHAAGADEVGTTLHDTYQQLVQASHLVSSFEPQRPPATAGSRTLAEETAPRS